MSNLVSRHGNAQRDDYCKNLSREVILQSTLVSRNLYVVFGENDPARRRAAIDEIYNEDCVFYDPTAASTVAATRSIASRA